MFMIVDVLEMGYNWKQITVNTDYVISLEQSNSVGSATGILKVSDGTTYYVLYHAVFQTIENNGIKIAHR